MSVNALLLTLALATTPGEIQIPPDTLLCRSMPEEDLTNPKTRKTLIEWGLCHVSSRPLRAELIERTEHFRIIKLKGKDNYYKPSKLYAIFKSNDSKEGS